MTAATPCALRIRVQQDFHAGRRTNAEERLLARRTCRCVDCVRWRRRQKESR